MSSPQPGKLTVHYLCTARWGKLGHERVFLPPLGSMAKPKALSSSWSYCSPSYSNRMWHLPETKVQRACGTVLHTSVPRRSMGKMDWEGLQQTEYFCLLQVHQITPAEAGVHAHDIALPDMSLHKTHGALLPSGGGSTHVENH